MNDLKTGSGKSIFKRNIFWLIVFALLTVVVWNLPGGFWILYPFTILGTWFHEMSHGIAALFLGGSFHRLEMFPDGSGVAYFSGNLFGGPLGMAMVAFAGPLGPTIAGSLFILASYKHTLTKWLLLLIGAIAIISAIVWVRSPFGTLFMIAFGIALLFATIKSNDKIRRFIVQFLGIQAIMSLYLSIGYLFSGGADIAVGSMKSDTGVIEQYLFLPYWFWGAAILIFSAFMIFKSLQFVHKQEEKILLGSGLPGNR